MKLFLTSSPIGTYRSDEPLTYSGFNPANGMVEELKRYWKDDSQCLLISAFPDEYEFLIYKRGFWTAFAFLYDEGDWLTEF